MEPATYVRHYVDFAAGHPDRRVLFTLVTNQPSGGAEPNQQPAVASYAQGDVASLQKGQGLAGRVMHYFSDRRRPGATRPAPFDENRTEALGVEIAVDGDDVMIDLIAHDWGDSRQRLSDLRVADGALLASGGSIGNQSDSAVYVISLGQTVAPG